VVFVSVFLLTIEYSFACLCLGSLFWYFFSKPNGNHQVSAGVKLITSYLLGQGMLANFWLLLAIYSWFSPILIKTITALLALAGIIFCFKDGIEFSNKIKQTMIVSLKDAWGWRIISILTVLSCLLWFTSLGRSSYGDGASFYLPIAKVTAESHSLRLLPGYEYLMSIGLQGEMHFAALMSLGSPGAARLFAWPTILAGAGMLLATAKMAGIKRRGQWLVLAMVFTSSAVIELSGSGKTDLFATALGFAAYYWAIKIQKEDNSLAFWLTGLFSGLTLIAKLSYIYTFIPSITILIVWSYIKNNKKGPREIFSPRQILVFFSILMGGILIAAIPHLVKNYTLFNNIFAPYGTSANGWQDQTWYGPNTTLRILLTIPFALTFGDYWAQIGNISPLPLIFAPLVFLMPRPRNLLNSSLFVITLAGIIGVTFWFVLRPSVLAPRYFMACLLLLILPIAKAVEHVSQHPSQFKLLSGAALTITALTLVMCMSFYTNKVFLFEKTVLYLTGSVGECELEARYCELITIINETAKPGERVLINNVRYWLRSDLIQCALTTEETEAYLELETPEQRWAFIYGRGFTLIPIINNWNPVENLLREDLKHIPDWLTVTKINEGNNLLFHLVSLDSSHRPVIQCSQIAPLEAWTLQDN